MILNFLGQIMNRKVMGCLLVFFSLCSNGYTAGDEHLKLPMLDNFIPAIGSNGKPIYVTDKDIKQMVLKHSPHLKKFYHNTKITRFIVADRKWLINLVSSYLSLLDYVGVKGEADTWDCENYSATLNGLTTLKVWKAGFLDTRAAIGWLKVDAQHSWAGLPAVNHALMFTVTRKGFIIFEPQNGKYIQLAKYPNREFIEEVYLF